MRPYEGRRSGGRYGESALPADQDHQQAPVADLREADDLLPHRNFGRCGHPGYPDRHRRQKRGRLSAANLVQPRYVAADSAGNFYFTDTYFEQVFRVTAAGVITAYAGNGTRGFSGDGGQATAAELSQPEGLAVDSSGNLYIADGGNYRIRMVTPTGVISTVALIGTGALALAVDGSGNLYVAGGEVVVKVNSA